MIIMHRVEAFSGEKIDPAIHYSGYNGGDQTWSSNKTRIAGAVERHFGPPTSHWSLW